MVPELLGAGAPSGKLAPRLARAARVRRRVGVRVLLILHTTPLQKCVGEMVVNNRK